MDAMILAGGKGIRLREVMNDRPKPMAEVGRRPFVELLLWMLRDQDVRRVILCTGYKGDMIEAHFGSGKQWGMEIICSRESIPLGTAGAVRLALKHVRSNPFLVMNGDSYCRVDVNRLKGIHVAHNARATLWLMWVDDCRRYGTVLVGKTGAVRAFREKMQEKRAGLVNAGVYLLEREVAETIPEGQKVSLETEVFPQLVGRGLHATVGNGPFLDIGTPETYNRASEELA